jgi:hypothetical protein
LPREPGAVARLRQERELAELCASVFRKYANGAALDRAAFDYGEARADYDAVVGGLETALAADKRPASVPDLDTRLQRGFDKRTAFCEQAKHLLPPKKPGEKGVVEEIVKGAVGPVVEAVVKIAGEAINGPPGRRETIRTQLEETKWPPFASVSPLS